jgi:hypothetical protein
LDETLKLETLTLAYIVGRLQYINLSRTPGDVKGEAFQTFVYRHQRGDRGEFFTPHPIVRLAVEIIAPKPNETSLILLVAVVDFLFRRFLMHVASILILTYLLMFESAFAALNLIPTLPFRR